MQVIQIFLIVEQVDLTQENYRVYYLSKKCQNELKSIEKKVLLIIHIIIRQGIKRMSQKIQQLERGQLSQGLGPHYKNQYDQKPEKIEALQVKKQQEASNNNHSTSIETLADFFPIVGVLIARWTNSAKKMISKNIGSAIALTPSLVMTCTHNLFALDKRRYANQIFFYPGIASGQLVNKATPYQGEPFINEQPFRKVIFEVKPLKEQFNMFKLQKKLPQNYKFPRLGYLKPQYLSHSKPQIHIFGYPGIQTNRFSLIPSPIDSKYKHLQGSINTFKPDQYTLNYDIKTYKGISGSPIITIMRDGLPAIIGIHTHQGDKNYNSGICFTQGFLEEIKKIEAEAKLDDKIGINIMDQEVQIDLLAEPINSLDIEGKKLDVNIGGGVKSSSKQPIFDDVAGQQKQIRPNRQEDHYQRLAVSPDRCNQISRKIIPDAKWLEQVSRRIQIIGSRGNQDRKLVEINRSEEKSVQNQLLERPEMEIIKEDLIEKKQQRINSLQLMDLRRQDIPNQQIKPAFRSSESYQNKSIFFDDYLSNEQSFENTSNISIWDEPLEVQWQDPGYDSCEMQEPKKEEQQFEKQGKTLHQKQKLGF